MTAGGFETHTVKTYNRIREWIISGHLAPGTRLVRRSLSKELGVSPIPVTEALLRLGEEGLVETEPMYGSRVTRLTLEALRNDQMLREALECQIARLCAERATPENLAELVRLAERLDAEIHETQTGPVAERAGAGQTADMGKDRAGMRTHLGFHLALARMSGFPLLEKELRKVWTRRLTWMNWMNASMFSVPQDWHRRLVDAVASGDAQRAEEAARQHVRHGQEHDEDLLRRLPETGAFGETSFSRMEE